MKTGNATVVSRSTPTYFRWPRTVIARFVIRRTIRGATFTALALGAFVASKAIGYVKVYPTIHDRAVVGGLLNSNVGFKALFGEPHNLDTFVGYASWYGVAVGVILGSIWAYLAAVRSFRGEEAAGRWEIMLAGQTTPRRAAANGLIGLGASLTVFYVIVAAMLAAVGQANNDGYAASSALYFALAVIAGAVMFIAVGAFTSQLMPTRARAVGLATAVFGISFLIRAAGDITDAHWLLNITPFGWVEKLQPLVGARPAWLLPILGFTAVLSAATIWLAGRRDLGKSIISDRESAKPHTALLRSPFTAAIRLTRGQALSWLVTMLVFLAAYGSLTRTAANVIGQSAAAQHLANRLTGAATETGARTFLGIAYFMFILLLMSYVASAVGAMRSDEAQGYLDNMLVAPVGRQRWLWGRMVLILVVGVAAALCSAVIVWLAMTGHHDGVWFHDLLRAGLNALPSAVLTLGVGVFAFAVVPRLTAVVTYGVVAWSFLIQMISSGTNLNHWILDTSVLNHVAFAPAANPKWAAGWALVAIGVLLALIGALVFNRRDLVPE